MDGARKLWTFSTGMCTRLGIAASLVADPPLLLWDEPTAGLDPSARRFTLELIHELGKTKTIVVATHILADIDQICDRVGVMHEGRVIFSGTMREMKQRLRRDDFSLELDGSDDALAALAVQVDGLEGVEARVQEGHTLLVRVAEDRRRAAAMAEVLRMVDAADLSLQAIHSGRDATENAYLQLLQEDVAHGFHRFDTKGGHPNDALPGDTPA